MYNIIPTSKIQSQPLKNITLIPKGNFHFNSKKYHLNSRKNHPNHQSIIPSPKNIIPAPKRILPTPESAKLSWYKQVHQLPVCPSGSFLEVHDSMYKGRALDYRSSQ